MKSDLEYREKCITKLRKLAVENKIHERFVPYIGLGFLGMSHTEETKQKMRKPKNQGAKNSQYGTMWVTDGVKNKKIPKGAGIPRGFYKGRFFSK